MPDVNSDSPVLASIIIVNYNGRGFIMDCLKAVAGQSFRNFEVIIIDNNSGDGSAESVRRYLEENGLEWKLIPLGTNLGFAGANLEGLKEACGRYIALLNPDTAADSSWLAELVRAMDAHPEAGICASKMIAGKTGVIDTAGDSFSSLLKGFKRGEGDRAIKYDRQEYVFGACAGAALYRREMLDGIGFLDEDFFLGHEDTDLNLRAQLAGWKALYVPSAVVFHEVGASRGKMSGMSVYYTLRNTELVRIKNVPASVFLRYFPQFLAGVFFEFFYFVLKHKKCRQYAGAKLDVLRMLPGMLRKRAAIMKSRKLPDSALAGLISPVLEKDFLNRKMKKMFME